jgi:drug/metabolite transporter (DMT)-like permease
MQTIAAARPDQRLRGIASMTAAAFVFALMDASMKHLSGHYGAFEVAALRCLSSLAFLCGPILWRRSWKTLIPRSPLLHCVRGVLGIVMLASFVFAVRALSLAATYALFLCAPLLMTALSVPVYGDRVPPRRWLAIGAGLGGVLLILRPSAAGTGSKIAVAAAALSAACYALSALSVRRLGRHNSSTSMVFWNLLIAGVGCAALAAGHWRSFAASDGGWLAFVGICGALGQFWLTEAFRLAPPSVVGPFEYTSILWAFALDWLFWSAVPGPTLLAGAAIVIGGGLFVIADERRLVQLAVTPASPPP